MLYILLWLTACTENDLYDIADGAQADSIPVGQSAWSPVLTGATASQLHRVAIRPGEQKLIPAKVVTQQYSRWCWAAVLETFLSAYGEAAEQCEIVEDALRLDAAVPGDGECCRLTADFDSPHWCNTYNTLNGGDDNVRDLVQGYGIDGMISDALTFAETAAAISEGRPLIVQWLRMGASAHFIVINGYQVTADGEQLIYYIDPWPGEGASVATYEWMRASDIDKDTFHVWSKTLVGLTCTGFSCAAPPANGITCDYPAVSDVHRIETDSGSDGASSCGIVPRRSSGPSLWGLFFW